MKELQAKSHDYSKQKVSLNDKDILFYWASK